MSRKHQKTSEHHEHHNSKTANVVTFTTSIQGSDCVAETPTVSPISDWPALGVADWLCVCAKNLGYKYPTPIQQATIPAILLGRDVIGCAETGAMLSRCYGQNLILMY